MAWDLSGGIAVSAIRSSCPKADNRWRLSWLMLCHQRQQHRTVCPAILRLQLDVEIEAPGDLGFSPILILFAASNLSLAPKVTLVHQLGCSVRLQGLSWCDSTSLQCLLVVVKGLGAYSLRRSIPTYSTIEPEGRPRHGGQWRLRRGYGMLKHDGYALLVPGFAYICMRRIESSRCMVRPSSWTDRTLYCRWTPVLISAALR